LLLRLSEGLLFDYGLSQEEARRQFLKNPNDDSYYETIQNASILTACGGDIIVNAAEIRAERELRKKRNALLLALGEKFPYGSPESFFAAKGQVENSEIFREFIQAPKGAGLHLHLELAGNFTWLSEILVSQIWWDKLYTDINGSQWYMQPRDTANLFKASQILPRDANFLQKQIVVQAKDAWQSPDAWNVFFAIFERIENLFNYMPFLSLYLENLLIMFRDQGYQYLELKHSLGQKYDSKYNLSIAEELEIYQNLSDSILPFRLIITGDRHSSALQVLNTAQTQLPISSMVTAFDLVNEEDKGHSHVYHSNTSLAYASHKKKLILHGGETAFARDTNRVRVGATYDRDVYAPARNVMEALRLGAHRVGHNLAAGHDLLALRAYAASKTCAVVNPMSNSILRFQSDLRSHPGRLFCSAQAPFAISNDDNAALGTNPPTHDIFAIYISWGLDLAQLKAILMQSFTCATIPLNLAEFEARWQHWVSSITTFNDDDTVSVWTETDEHEFQRWSELHSTTFLHYCDQGVLIIPQMACRCFQGYTGPLCNQPITSYSHSTTHLFLLLVVVVVVVLGIFLFLFFSFQHSTRTLNKTTRSGSNPVITPTSSFASSSSSSSSFFRRFFLLQRQQDISYTTMASSSASSQSQRRSNNIVVSSSSNTTPSSHHLLQRQQQHDDGVV